MKLKFLHSIFFQQFLVTIVLTNTLSEREENKACQQDYYSPCECITYSEEPVSIGIICRDVNSFSVVQEVFRRPTTAKEIQTFDLRIPTSEINNTIPSDLLNSTVVKSILLDCYNELTYLRIDPKSFSASTDDNEFIGIENCDLSLLNYKFLENFTALNYLLYFNVVSLSSSWVSLPVLSSLAMIRVSETEEFEGFNRFPISNVPAWSELEVFSCPHFQFLPTPLPSFKILTICMCPLFKQWNIIGQLKKLSSIHLEGFNEEEINNALDTFVLSPLVDTIVTLDLSFNKLTNVPAQIKSFSQLQYIYLTSNTISTANKESLAFITPYLKELSLLENGLSNIEPGAFQGNFRNCEIDLRSNNLTRFKSSVFKPSLEQMEKHIGFIIIYENLFECDCHLAWLFRDNPNLRNRVWSGECSNGTFFSQLTTQDFEACPAVRTTRETSSSITSTTTETSIVSISVETKTTGVSSSIHIFDRIYFVLILATFLSLD